MTTDDFYASRGPDESYLGKYYCRILLGEYNRTRPFEPGDWKPNNALFLPLPRELTDDSLVQYSETNLEGVGDLINLNPAGLAGRLVLNGVGPLIEAGVQAGAAGVGGSFGTKVVGGIQEATGLTGKNITSAIQNVIGRAPNPNPAVLFSGPQLREMTFSWAFYPKTAAESKKIDKMIKILKRAALPKHTLSSSTGVLKYPDLCQINFFPWDTGGGKNSWGWTDRSIMRIKKCFLKSVRVNYSDFGNPAFFEGTELPIMYRLNITFQEVEYMLAKDWEDIPENGYRRDTEETGAQGFSDSAAGAQKVAETLGDKTASDILKFAADTGAQGAEDKKK